MNFEELVQKNKSDLVSLASDIKSPNQKSKKELIELLADPPFTDIEFSVLYLNHGTDDTWSTAIRKKCGELDVEYTKVAESAIRLVDRLDITPDVDKERLKPKINVVETSKVEKEFWGERNYSKDDVTDISIHKVWDNYEKEIKEALRKIPVRGWNDKDSFILFDKVKDKVIITDSFDSDYGRYYKLYSLLTW